MLTLHGGIEFKTQRSTANDTSEVYYRMRDMYRTHNNGLDVDQ